MVYTVTLNPALDYVMHVEKLRYDDINRTTAEEIYYGGKGINVSVILSRLGIKNTALGFLAGFTGKELEKMLINDGINCDFNYLKSGNTRINVKIKADTQLDINANGPHINSADIEALLSKLEGIQSGDYLVLAGSIPANLPDDIYRRILLRVADRGVNVAVDATGDLLMNVLQYKPFLVKPNHLELGEIFGKNLSDKEDVITYAKELQKMGARNVLISMAGDGAILITEEGETIQMGTPKGKVINSVGAGDSMVAGFVAGYLKNNSYEEALKTGTAAGSATAFSEGLASIEMIQAMMEQIEK